MVESERSLAPRRSSDYKTDKHGTLPDELRLKYISNDDPKPSDKEQLPKPMWQSVRDDLRRGTMILPSSHSQTQWGRLHENHVEVKDL